ncbi:hypothetical protein ACIOWF_05115 [Cellulosimicrobium cellulans]|uniref:hypothetical protein n=1 Tax=Cellulosimicrobium cellulans TaxID=1710 RepID=UPI00380B2C45
MAEGVTIGRVAVRVVPDTSTFARDLKANLERIERNAPAVEIDAVLNSKMLNRHADAVVKRMNSKAERARRQIVFDADLDLNGIEQRARAAAVEIDKSLRDAVLDLAAALDQDSLRKVRHDLDNLVDDYDGKDVELQTTVDSVVARAELARVSRDRFVNLHVQVSKASIAKAETTLAALSGLRMLGSTLDNLSRVFRNLDKNIPLIGTIAEAVMGLSAWLLAAASNTFILARDLAQLGGAALALPGIFGGIAFGLGSTFAVLKDFNAVLPEVGRELDHLQDAMSGDFWSIAAQPIRDLTRTLLPQLEAGLRVTSTALGRWFSSLASSLGAKLPDSLSGMFANLAASIEIASGANSRLANIIEILGASGSKYLPRLAGWYADIAKKFSLWLTKAESTGRLNEIIETALTNARDLGTVLLNAGGILAGIARAAQRAGGSGLNVLADALERIHEVVDSAAFQDRLVSVLRGAHDAMGRIARDSGPAVKAFFRDFSSTLADGFRSAGDAIGSLLDGVFRGLNADGFAAGFLDFLDGVRDGIRSLAPMWEPLGAAIGAIGTLAGELARQFGPLLARVLTSLANIVLDVVPKLTPVVEALTATLGNALAGVLPIVSGLVDAFTGLVTPILSTEAGVIAVTTALVGFRLAIAARGMEAGLAALLSFFGAESKARGMASAIGTLGTKLGVIGTVAAATVGLVSWASQIGAKSAGVEEFSLALERLGDAKTVENLTKLEGLFQGGGNWLQESGESAADVKSLADAIGFLEDWNSTGWWDKFLGGNKSGDGLWMHSAAMVQAKDSVADLDAALAQAASSGNAEALAAAQDWLAQSAADSGISVDTLAARYLPEYSRALEANALAQQAAAREAAVSSAAQADALRQYEEAIGRVNGLSPQTIQALNDVSTEFINFGAALEGDALPSVDAWLTKLEEQQTAMQNWADNMATLAQKGVSEGVLLELAKLGPEGAPMVAQLVNASDTELARLESVMKSKTEGAVSSATGAFATLDEKTRAELDKLPPEARAVLEEMGVLMNTGGANAVNAMAVGMGSQGQYVYTTADGIARTAASALSNGIPTASQHGAATASGYSNAVSRGQGAARSAGSGLGSAAVSGASGYSLYGTGQALAQGLASGITSAILTVASAAASVVSNAVAAAKAAADVNSPSRVMRDQVGIWMSLGLAEGIKDKGKVAVDAMKSVVKDVASVDFQDPLAGRGAWSTRVGSASATAAMAEGGAPAGDVFVPVNFNAPVGGDPYELAASVQQKVLDGLNAEGLVS